MKLQELINKYPKIFDKSTYSIGWWAPDTWIPLIDELCNTIQNYCDTHPEEKQIVCEQMKEKFGGLRFYVNFATDEIYKHIKNCEKQSYELCQECGCTNDLGMTKGWMTILCKLCAIKLNKEMRED